MYRQYLYTYFNDAVTIMMAVGNIIAIAAVILIIMAAVIISNLGQPIGSGRGRVHAEGVSNTPTTITPRRS